jgi:hypothetical protein
MGKKNGAKKQKRLKKGALKSLSKNYCHLSRSELRILESFIELLERPIKKNKKKKRSFSVLFAVLKSMVKNVTGIVIRKLFNF